MLILAGVSLNAMIGDNGIINSAQRSKILQSCAVLQEFLEEKACTDLEGTEDYDNKIDYIVNRYPNYLYRPNASTSFITDPATGYIYYLVNKSGLPEEIQKQLVGGDAGEKKYTDYAHFNDVYGVTKDLQVYYCSGGSETRLGAADVKEKDNPARVVMSSSSSLGNYLKEKFPEMIKTDEYGNVLAENLSSIRSFEINNKSSIKTLSELAYLPGLQEIKIINQTLDDLNGIENLIGVTSIYFQNVNIADYSRMSGLENLTTIRMYKVNDTQVDNMCSGIANAKFTKLSTLRIEGNDSTLHGTAWAETGSRSEVTKLDGFLKLSSVTKKVVRTLYLNNNKITSLYALDKNGERKSVLTGFSSVTTLRLGVNELEEITALSETPAVVDLYVNSNKIKSLDGIQHITSLNNLYASSNRLGEGIDGNTKNSETDALSCLPATNHVRYLDLSGNKMKWVEYLTSCASLTSVNLRSCPNIEDFLTLKDIIEKVSYDQKYADLIVDSTDLEKVPFVDRTYGESEFRQIFSPNVRKKLKYLSLQNLTLTKQVEVGGVKQTVEITDATEYSSIVNEVLGQLSGLLAVDLRGNKLLNEISFMKNFDEISEIDLRGTMVTTKPDSWDNSKVWNGLELLNGKMKSGSRLWLDSTNTANRIDCKKIQSAISSATGYGSRAFDGSNLWGFIASNEVYKTLPGCTELTTLVLGRHDSWISGYTLDLSGCSSLTYYEGCGISITIKFPSSLKTAYLAYGHDNFSFASGTELNLLDIKQGWCVNYTASYVNTRWKKLEGIPVKELYFRYASGFSIGNVGETDASDNFRVYDLDIESLLVESASSPNWNLNLANLGRIKGLKKFTTWGTNNVSGLDNIGTCSTLEEFIINGWGSLNISNLNFVSNLSNLKTLYITGCSIDSLLPLVTYTVDGEGNIQPNGVVLNNLVTLNLSGCMLSDGIEKTEGFVNNVKILKYINDTQKGKGLKFTFNVNNNKFSNVAGILN